MTGICLDRVQALVESRFERAEDGGCQSPVYSFRIGFPLEPTQKQKRQIYYTVKAFADQLKRQTGGSTLRWRTKPELGEEMSYEPCEKYRTLYFRASADSGEGTR